MAASSLCHWPPSKMLVFQFLWTKKEERERDKWGEEGGRGSVRLNTRKRKKNPYLQIHRTEDCIKRK